MTSIVPAHAHVRCGAEIVPAELENENDDRAVVSSQKGVTGKGLHRFK